MTDTTASFDDVNFFGGRGFALGDMRALVRGVLGSAGMGFCALAAVGATIALATVSGVWMVGVALTGNPHLQARAPAGPARLALADPAAFPPSSFEAKWAPTTAIVSAEVGLAGQASNRRLTQAGPAVPVFQPEVKVKREVSDAAAPTYAPTKVAKLVSLAAKRPEGAWLADLTPSAGVLPPPSKPKVARAAPVPLPRARPALPEIARAPASTPVPKVKKPAPQVAIVTPPPAPSIETRAAPLQAHTKAPSLPGPDSRTALYDISGHTVYMPDGKRLEAHSGLGNEIDNPRYVRVRMRGPTPPNVYDLTLRKHLFHGVHAIRLNPVDEHKMFGRAGMLAHPYMLGPNGQSNGCVSFKHYHRFLQAFLNGEVDRMVVVRNLDDAPAQLASLVRAPRSRGTQYAANELGVLDPANW